MSIFFQRAAFPVRFVEFFELICLSVSPLEFGLFTISHSGHSSFHSQRPNVFGVGISPPVPLPSS